MLKHRWKLGMVMLKAILMLLLSVAFTNAAAREFMWAGDTHAPKGDTRVNPDADSEWLEVARQKTYIVFVNPNSIRKKGDAVTASLLYELQLINEVAGKPFRSVKAQAEYDCVKVQSRTLAATAHTGKMGGNEKMVIPGNDNLNNIVEGGKGGPRGGVVNRISEPTRWKQVAPGSADETLLKYACGK